MTMKPLSIALAAAVVLSACSGGRHEDLQQWVKEQDNMPRPRIEPVPEVKPYQPFAYSAFDLDDPFKTRKAAAQAKKPGSGGLQPDLNRRKEPLEGYPLENLRMVGTLQDKKDTFALIKTPDNNLFRVKRGSYLGQNFGVVLEISEAVVKLKEIVQDGGGEWTERVSNLQLQDEQEAPKK